MAQEVQPSVYIREFKGQTSNKNPHNLEPGEFQVQLNCMVRRPGELVVRGGLREQTWDTE